MLFKELGLETREILKAAGTKWNFQPFRPGTGRRPLHRVDPYYLTHKAVESGFIRRLAGINDGMAGYVAADGLHLQGKLPDTRNTKVADLVSRLNEVVAEVVVYNPMADREAAEHEFGIAVSAKLPVRPFDASPADREHDQIVKMGESSIRSLLTKDGLLYDVVNVMPSHASDGRAVANRKTNEDPGHWRCRIHRLSYGKIAACPW